MDINIVFRGGGIFDMKFRFVTIFLPPPVALQMVSVNINGRATLMTLAP